MSGSTRDLILRLLDEADGRSLAPEAVARALDPDGWRRRLTEVRAASVALAREGRLDILRHGAPADPSTFKGVYRLRLAARDPRPQA